MLYKTIAKSLREQTSIAPLITFRIVFGLITCYGALRFILNGWVEKLIGEPTFYFSYYGFHWLPRPSVEEAYWLYAIIALTAFFVTIGLFYRLSIFILLICFTYVQLIDATNYLNHYYLVICLLILLQFVEANGAVSIDEKLGFTTTRHTIPKWQIAILIGQLCIVYFYAGVAKLNYDWLFRAMPLAIWLPEKSDTTIIGYFFNYAWVPFAFSWAGAIYDLCIWAFLLNKKSRPFAYLLTIIFHGMTWILFNIGLFPIIMIGSNLIFFSGRWHERIYSKLKLWPSTTSVHPDKKKYRILPYFMGFYFFIQFVLPLRAYAYGTPLAWGEEGYRFGWRVMLVEKVGHAEFKVVDGKSKRQIIVDNSKFLTPYQEKQMAIQPDFILQYAKHLAHFYEANHDFIDAKVYVEAYVSLNRSKSLCLIKLNNDIAAESDGFLPKHWIVPFK